MKNGARIQALKDAGYRVKVAHLRTLEGRDDGLILPKHIILGNHPETSPGQRGGETHVALFDAKDNFVIEGIAHCNPKDPFNRRLGLTIALNRLEKTLKEIT